MKLPKEVWRVIPSLAPDYEASSLGRIRRATDCSRYPKGSIIEGWTSALQRYPRTVLRGKIRSLHLLVLEAFTGVMVTRKNRTSPFFYKVIFLDGDVTNRRFDNLVLDIRTRHVPSGMGAGNWVTGEGRYNARLTEGDVRRIRRLQAQGESRRALAKEYGVSYSAVQRIVSRQSWRHVT